MHLFSLKAFVLSIICLSIAACSKPTPENVKKAGAAASAGAIIFCGAVKCANEVMEKMNSEAPSAEELKKEDHPETEKD